MKEMKVIGTYEKKEVSQLNNDLYSEGLNIMYSNQHYRHIGLSGFGKFIDWLEENYDIEPKAEKESNEWDEWCAS